MLRKKIFISRFVSFLCSKREADAQNVIGFGGFIGKRSADAEPQFGHGFGHGGFGHGGFGHGGFGGHHGGFGGYYGKRSAEANVICPGPFCPYVPPPPAK